MTPAVVLIACLVEYACPPVYYILSFIIPIAMTLQCVYTEGIPSVFLLVCCTINAILYIGVPMSVCLHRFFSHHAFKTSRACQFVVGIVACFAWQGSPLFWAQTHIRHHKHCDTPDDPHSVKQSGFWYSCVGWMADPKNYKSELTRYDLLEPHMCTPEMRVIHVLHPVPPLCMCLAIMHYSGYQAMIFSCLVPLVVCRAITLLFNVEFHPVSPSEACLSTDQDRILARIVGESKHKDHHAHPRRARRPDFDIPHFLTIRWMQWTGLVWDCV